MADGREVEATPMTVSSTSEQWNHYLLEDGSSVKVRLVLTKVLRLENEYDVEKNPVYVLQSTNVVAVESPEHLKKKG